MEIYLGIDFFGLILLILHEFELYSFCKSEYSNCTFIIDFLELISCFDEIRTKPWKIMSL